MTITLTREEAQQVLAVLDDLSPQHGRPDDVEEAIETLRARLSAPEPEPMRLRRGDTLRCFETNELCTVWATSTTGKTLVKWKANDFGSYTAEQIGDLFWVELKPEPEPVAKFVLADGLNKRVKLIVDDLPIGTLFYTTPPQREWQGLTDEEAIDIEQWSPDVRWAIIRTGAKLKEKNT